ncbi:gluconate 2-dehydrogenase subunit 3 family protein [Arthrobacter sp. NyZ413]|uniref:gluconate 2-dehydrogenase subunit 3 family protein n=1 Tax=Arthrobacter sp. NyZ413 TaxID=3144669 RepID=UPI003BF90F89
MPTASETTATHWAFFSHAEAETVEAVCERIFPSDDGKPGARDIRVVTFIDKATAEEDVALRRCYRDGVKALNNLCVELYSQEFAALSPEQQDSVLERIDASSEADHARADDLLATFFALVWEHTIQGLFCDPGYGGNHDALGWKLVGFPGAQWGYNAAQMKPGFDSTTIPIKTLDDLRRELRRHD